MSKQEKKPAGSGTAAAPAAPPKRLTWAEKKTLREKERNEPPEGKQALAGPGPAPKPGSAAWKAAKAAAAAEAAETKDDKKKAWTGKTPVTQLNEYCQKNGRSRPNFLRMRSREGHLFRAVIMHKNVEESFYPPTSFATEQEARHAAAVAALHHYNHHLPLYRVLQPEFRDLWFELDKRLEQRKEVEKAAEESQRERDEREERQRLKEAAHQRLPQIFMNDDIRRRIEAVIRQLRSSSTASSSSSASSSNSGRSAAADAGDPDARQRHGVYLAHLGFPIDAVHRALAFTGGNDLTKAFDWLCLHLPESQIPAAFGAAKGKLEFVNYAAGKSPASVADSWEQSTDSGAPSDSADDVPEQSRHDALTPGQQRTVDFLEGIGFDHQRCVTLVSDLAPGQSLAALQTLFAEACGLPPPTYLELSRTVGRDVALVLEEIVVLQTIYGDELKVSITRHPEEPQPPPTPDAPPFDAESALSAPGAAQQAVVLTIALDTLLRRPGCALELYLLPSMSYPAEIPIAAVRGKDLTQAARNALMRGLAEEAKRHRGETMIYQLVLWLQSSFDGVLLKAASWGVSKRDKKPPVIPAADTRGPKINAKFCKHFGQNRCSYGPQCRYLHQLPPPSPAVQTELATRAVSDLSLKETAVDEAASSQAEDVSAVVVPRKSRRAPPAVPASERQARSKQLRDEYLAQKENAKFKEMRAARERLPALKKASELVKCLRANQIVVVSGQTGSGKSTQVPQLILEDALESMVGADCNIICTQPRRISAIGLAERVSAERAERLGETVGYQVRLESSMSKRTQILYCTTGILLRRLQGDRELRGVSHVIIDEVHERSLDIDFLLIIMRDLVRQRRDLKLVLMSASLDAEMFARYFGGAAMFNIPGFTFPVKEFYLEDVIEMLSPDPKALAPRASRRWDTPAPDPTLAEADDADESEQQQEQQQRSSGFVDGAYDTQFDGYRGSAPPARSATPTVEAAAAGSRRLKAGKAYLRTLEEQHMYGRNTLDCLLRLDEDAINFDLLELLLLRLAATIRSGGAILVFLPGMAGIVAMVERVKRSKSSLYPLPLHSSLTTADQRRVFERAPKGQVKVVFSTNIAETSITLEDVVVVVDAGKSNQTQYDAGSQTPRLAEAWISKANALQRRGRAGRVSEGTCYRLYTRHRYDDEFESQEKPEIMRVPLQQLCLQIKLLGFGSIMQFLGSAPQSPERAAIAAAVDSLIEFKCLTPKQDLTALGYHLSLLSVDQHIGKMMLYGALFRCIDPILTICATLAARSPFISPFDKRQEADAARSMFSWAHSDHLMVVKAYNAWRHAAAGHGGADFCSQHFLSLPTLKEIRDLKRQFADQLAEIGFLDAGHRSNRGKQGTEIDHGKGGLRQFEIGGAESNVHSNDIKVLKGVLCAALYPKVCKVATPLSKFQQVSSGAVAIPTEAREHRFRLQSKERVFIHPRSVNFKLAQYEFTPWLIFHDKIQTTKVYLSDTTMVDPYALLLFGGELTVMHEYEEISIDHWIKLRAPARIAVLVKEIRHELDKLLAMKIEDPQLDISSNPLVETITALLQFEGL